MCHKVNRTSIALRLAVFFLFGGFRKTDFHKGQNLHLFLVDQYWSTIGCLFHTTFKMERQTLMSINNSNRDLHF